MNCVAVPEVARQEAMVLRCFEWKHFRVRTGELTPERCVEFVEIGHFPAVGCCIRELFPTDISRRGDSRIAHTYLPEGDLRIAHPFKGGIAKQIPKVPKGRLSHSRAILCPEQTVRIGVDVGHWGIRPSLRDLCDGSFEPSSELLG